MPAVDENDERKVRKLTAWYNAVANVFWSALNLIPPSIFCYRHVGLKLFLVFLAVSLVSLFLPRIFFDSIQLGQTAPVYRKIGIRFINRFTQNGDIINHLVRKQFPRYKVVSGSRRSIKRLIAQTYLFEKFHFMMFLLFSFIIVDAIAQKYFGWAFIMFINNAVYNVYPNFLQQYIRIRLRTSDRRLP